MIVKVTLKGLPDGLYDEHAGIKSITHDQYFYTLKHFDKKEKDIIVDFRHYVLEVKA